MKDNFITQITKNNYNAAVKYGFKSILSIIQDQLHYLKAEKKKKKKYSLHLTFFVLFEKSNFLREHHLLSCLLFKNVYVSKTTLKKIYQKIELVN